MNIQWFRRHFLSEVGKAESKMPMMMFLLIVGGLLFFGYKFGKPWYQNRSFEYAIGEVVQIDKFSKNERSKTDEDIYNEVQDQARNILNHSLEKSEINVIKVEKDQWQVEVTYSLSITLPFKKPIVKHYHFIKIGN